MAKRRMFNTEMVDTDAFLNLSVGAKLLYFYFGTHGDDDGFIASPRMLMRAVGCGEEDLALLVSNPFDSGVIALRDWRLNNDLKNDRYHATIYKEEKATLTLDSNKRYTFMTDTDTSCIQLDSIPETEHSIAEQSIAEQSTAEQSAAEQSTAEPEKETVCAAKPPRPRFSPPGVEEVAAYCTERKNGIDPQRFVDFYTANGWVQNRNKPIKDWRAAVRLWERRDKHGRDDPGDGYYDTPIEGVCRF